MRWASCLIGALAKVVQRLLGLGRFESDPGESQPAQKGHSLHKGLISFGNLKGGLKANHALHLGIFGVNQG